MESIVNVIILWSGSFKRLLKERKVVNFTWWKSFSFLAQMLAIFIIWFAL